MDYARWLIASMLVAAGCGGPPPAQEPQAQTESPAIVSNESRGPAATAPREVPPPEPPPEPEEITISLPPPPPPPPPHQGGTVGGVVGGVQGGVLGGTGAPPPPAAGPKIVPPKALEALRVSGSTNIVPSAAVQAKMKADQSRSRYVSVFKVCVANGGRVRSYKVLKSSGYPAYDKRLGSAIRKWRYRPFRINGKPVAVCTTVTFLYRP